MIRSQRSANSARIESLSNAFRALAAAVVVKEFIDANVELQKFERAMVLLKGSTEGAATEFEYVRELSRRLGLELFTTADAYTSLTAATKGQRQGQSTRDIFEAVSIAMSSLGKSSADTQGALLAISQIVSKGNVSLEELRASWASACPVRSSSRPMQWACQHQSWISSSAAGT